MDNRNDLQWRPEDWEHTLGHLRKAERLLLLKTWGVGTAVAGTVVTAAAVYFQPEPISDAPVVTNRIEAVEAVQPIDVDAAANAASVSTTWAEAVEAAEAAEAEEVALLGDSEIPENATATPAPSTPALAVPVQADLVSAVPTPANAEPKAAVPEAPRPAEYRSDSPLATTMSNRELRQAILETESATDAAADAAGDVEFEQALSLLERLAPAHLAHGEIPQFNQANKELSNVIVADRNVPPLRLSALPVQKGIALESPVTVGWAGGARLELTPGLSLATAPVQWTAWHPGEAFGSPSELRQVHSDLAIRSHAIVSGMKALSPVLEVGISVGVQVELTRRMDHGNWNPDANAWDEVFESDVWGRVEEANPWSAVAGLRLDYAVAPEWKIVAQAGWTMASDLARKQPAIDVSTSSPVWIQIGIQR
jgi:hypothetical protein